MISLLCPTRKRPDAIKRMVASVLLTALESNIEFIFNVDGDDDTFPLLDEINFIVLTGDRGLGYLELGRRYNECAKIANGDLLGVINDDLLFIRKGWDCDLLRMKNLFPTNIGCICEESSNEFPFVTKGWIEKLGYLTDPRETHNDTFIVDVAKRVNALTHIPKFLQASCLSDDTYKEAQSQVWSLNTPSLFDTPEHVAWRIQAVETLTKRITE